MHNEFQLEISAEDANAAPVLERAVQLSPGSRHSNERTDIPIVFRQVKHRIAVSTDGSTRTVSDASNALRLRLAYTPSTSDPVANERPALRWSDSHSNELGPLDQSKTSPAEPVQPQETAPRACVDSGDLPHSRLRLVARNDSPTSSGFNSLHAPELRLIALYAEPTASKPSEDLITRLSGSWENSFFSADEDTFASLPSTPAATPVATTGRIHPTRRIEPALRDNATICQHGTTGRPVSVRNDGIRIIHAASSPDGPRHTLISHQRKDVAGTVEDRAMRRPSAKMAPRSSRTSQSSTHPLPLFGDYLQDEMSAGLPLVGEPTLALRDAALEIASELRHVQSTGGMELLFRLHLHPEHLGAADIEIERVDDAWSISVATTNDEATRALATEISCLQHHFQESDLTSDAISVVTRSPTKYSRIW